MYDNNYVEKLINKYIEKGGVFVTIHEGCLGYGNCILYGDKLKTCIIKEVPVNSWCSLHKIRFYNNMPKKYQNIIDDII